MGQGERFIGYRVAIYLQMLARWDVLDGGAFAYDAAEGGDAYARGPSTRRRGASDLSRLAPGATVGRMGKKLPKELAENARKLKRNVAAMHRTRAQAALARFRAARDAVSHAWWEMGAALRELADPLALAALGRKDLAELCEKDLDISHAAARRILGVMARVTTDLASQVTLHRAEALIELADATPDDDAPESLVDATLTLPITGATLDVRAASTEVIAAAAKEFREARRASGGRGLSASADAKRLLRRLERAAKGDEDLAAMRLKLVASRDEEGAWLEVRVRASRAAALAKVAKLAKGGSVAD